MAENSNIEWTDHTFNPWSGCTKVAPECAHCYAEVNYSVKMRGVKWGPQGTRIKTANWTDPHKWNRQAACLQTFDCNAGSHSDACPQSNRPRVFCASLGDLFEEWDGPLYDHNRNELYTCPDCGCVDHEIQDGTGHVEHGSAQQEREGYSEWFLSCSRCGEDNDMPLATMTDLRRELFKLIDDTPNLDWLLLTKRPQNIRKMWPPVPAEIAAQNIPERPDHAAADYYRPNVWLGTSAGCQETADKFVPELRKCRDLSPVLFVSGEPLLGSVDYSKWLPSLSTVQMVSGEYAALTGMKIGDSIKMIPAGGAIDWVIVGGESGKKARPCNIGWIREIRDQCQAAGVPVFIKQLGTNLDAPIYECLNGLCRHRDTAEGFDVIGATGDHWFCTRCHLEESMLEVELIDKKGGDWNEWPADLRVRQFPKVEA